MSHDIPTKFGWHQDLKEAVMTGSIISIRARKDTATGLCPSGSGGRIRRSVPGQQPKTVTSTPAVACRVANVGLAAVVERCWPFVRIGHFLP